MTGRDLLPAPLTAPTALSGPAGSRDPQRSSTHLLVDRIDDARAFRTGDGYPPLKQDLRVLRNIDPTFKIGVSCDIIWAALTTLRHFEWRTLLSGAIVPPSAVGAHGAVVGDPAGGGDGAT